MTRLATYIPRIFINPETEVAVKCFGKRDESNRMGERKIAYLC